MTAMSLGLDDTIRLATMNEDFAHTRQKIMKTISILLPPHANGLDFNILKRLQVKEMIFFHVLAGERMRAIKQIPVLFRGSLPLKELLRDVAVSIMAFSILVFLYPLIVRTHRLLTRLKLLTL
jgi:hypothetical protein